MLVLLVQIRTAQRLLEADQVFRPIFNRTELPGIAPCSVRYPQRIGSRNLADSWRAFSTSSWTR